MRISIGLSQGLPNCSMRHARASAQRLHRRSKASPLLGVTCYVLTHSRMRRTSTRPHFSKKMRRVLILGDDSRSKVLLILNLKKELLENVQKRVIIVDRADASPFNSPPNLPGFANVNHIDSIGPRLPQVRLHVHLQILGAQVTLCCQQHLHVSGCRIEDRGQIGGRHDVCRRLSRVLFVLFVGWK